MFSRALPVLVLFVLLVSGAAVYIIGFHNSVEDRALSMTGAGAGVGYGREGSRYIFVLGNWSIEFLAYGMKSLVVVEYIGEEPLAVYNPLLPLTSGLDIEVRYSNGSIIHVRKPGTYYYNSSITIAPGTRDNVSFNIGDAVEIVVTGSILGRIPVRLEIPLQPLHSNQGVRTVTITMYKCIETTTTAYHGGSCSFIEIGSYSEPEDGELKHVFMGDETIVSNNLLEIHIPYNISSYYKLPLVIVNKGASPVVINKYQVYGRIINASRDGVKYTQLDYRFAFTVPTITTPKLPEECIYVKPDDTVLVTRYDIVFPENKTEMNIWFPSEIEGYGRLEGWAFIELELSYAPVKELYRISYEGELHAPYVPEYYLAASMYGWRTIDVVVEIHIG